MIRLPGGLTTIIHSYIALHMSMTPDFSHKKVVMSDIGKCCSDEDSFIAPRFLLGYCIEGNFGEGYIGRLGE